MKNLFIGVMAVLILAGCTPSNVLQISWKTGDYQPKRFTNIGVLALLKSDEARIDVETGIADALRSRGIRATVTWDIFPLANKADLVNQMGYTPEQLKELIVGKVKEHQMDALLIVTLFDAFKEQRYVPGKSVSVGIGISPDFGGMYPMYGYPYWDYYTYAFNTVTTPGYYEDASTYFTESNLYDIGTESLIWTGQISTKMQMSEEAEGEQLGRVLVRGLFSDKVIVR